MCLGVNFINTQVLFFNKPTNYLQDPFTFNKSTIDYVNNYKNLE